MRGRIIVPLKIPLCYLYTLAKKYNFYLYLVGGTIRDYFIGVDKEGEYDYDFVVMGRDVTEVAKEVTRQSGGKFIPLEQQTVRIAYKRYNLHIDISTPKAQTIEEDLRRRDFTINALAVRIHPKPVQLYDPLGGYGDIKKKLIRAPHSSVFEEDPLRCLRAFRFAAQFGFVIEKKTKDWIKKYKYLIKRVAGERINYEFYLILEAKKSAGVLSCMHDLSLLCEIFPELLPMADLIVDGTSTLLEHSLKTIAEIEKILTSTQLPHAEELKGYFLKKISHTYLANLKFASLLHDVGKPKTLTKTPNGKLHFYNHQFVGAEIFHKIGKRLHLSNKEINFIAELIKHHMRPGYLTSAQTFTERAIMRLYRDLGECYLGVLVLSLADHRATPTLKTQKKHYCLIQSLIKKYYEYESRRPKVRLISGDELISTFALEPSPLIGELLNLIEEAQLQGEITTKEEALGVAASYLESKKI